MQVEPSQKLTDLRGLFEQQKLDAYIVPHSDAHDSEYIGESDERLAFISGFTGSNGIAFVSQKQALMWTDSRYYIQAQKQLEAGWEMRKLELGKKSWFQEIKDDYNDIKIGFDPLLINAGVIQARRDFFKDSSIEMIAVQDNLVDKIWKNKPSDSTNKVLIHDDKWVGCTLCDKVKRLSEKVKELKGEALLVQKLDQIAWTLNLRGSDIEFNPVFKSYLLLEFDFTAEGQHKGTLYINKDKVPENIQSYLDQRHISIKGYKDVFADVSALKKKVVVTKTECSTLLFENIPKDLAIESTPSPIDKEKAVKTPKEVQFMRQCHIRDGSALVRYLAWLHDEVVHKGNKDLDEYTVAEKLAGFRYQLENNQGLSFATISSTGANAAIVHYKPEKGTSAKIDANQIYLVDSGGQYLDGTTDVTRTIHFTKPTDEEKDAQTRVLMGNLDVQTCIFPEKSKIAGSDIDILARRHLWQKKLDQGHGTGHGVGQFLNVHEGPHGMSKYNKETYEVGMIVTDEPGYYKEGSFGIRIEDLLVIVDVGDGQKGFENLTQCPYDRNLIDISLLSDHHINYINNYHKQVHDNLMPLLNKYGDVFAQKWLEMATKPLKKC